jgi:hypothetical protein
MVYSSQINYCIYVYINRKSSYKTECEEQVHFWDLKPYCDKDESDSHFVVKY